MNLISFAFHYLQVFAKNWTLRAQISLHRKWALDIQGASYGILNLQRQIPVFKRPALNRSLHECPNILEFLVWIIFGSRFQFSCRILPNIRWKLDNANKDRRIRWFSGQLFLPASLNSNLNSPSSSVYVFLRLCLLQNYTEEGSYWSRQNFWRNIFQIFESWLGLLVNFGLS
jgi:hypothetical protein